MERYVVNRRSIRKNEGLLTRWKNKYFIVRSVFNKRSWISSTYELNVSTKFIVIIVNKEVKVTRG